MSINDPRGSKWRKWDLHVHTPNSVIQNYGGDKESVWEKFISDLEELPEEYSVLGINDYMFLDGYEKVIDYREKGRVQNIDMIIPVIEFRLKQFAGKEGKWSRVNYHVIFSDTLKAEDVKNKFIYQLGQDYKVGGEEMEVYPTKEDIREYGQLVKENTPSGKQQNKSDLETGFESFTVSHESIHSALSKTVFTGKYLTAVGRAEWEEMRWDQSAGDKRSLISSADLVLVASYTPDKYDAAREALKEQGVNSKLVDSSDAHDYSHSDHKDRIGNSYTWIKADPTFEGLRFAVEEFEDRVEVNETPKKLSKVEDKPDKYIKKASIKKREGTQIQEKWFDIDIYINTHLTAIIGEKGSGKSALTDIISLVGGSTSDSFSFLTEDKFRHKDNGKADGFEASIQWESGATSGPKKLSEEISDHEVEKVKYISQNFFDRVCDEIKIKQGGLFDSEVKSVVFSHIPKEDRLGEGEFGDVIDKKTESIRESIRSKREKLSRINEEISDLEVRVDKDNIEEVETQLEDKREELKSHEEKKPDEEKAPEEPKEDSEISQKYNKLKDKIEDKEEEIQERENKLSGFKDDKNILENVIGKIENVIEYVEDREKNIQSDIENLDLDIEVEEIFKIETCKDEIEEELDSVDKEIKSVSKSLNEDEDGSLKNELSDLEDKHEELENKLNEKRKQYEKFKEKKEKWEKRKFNIIGDEDTPNTIKFYKNRLEYLEEDAPDDLEALYDKREKVASEIHDKLVSLAKAYKEFSKPAQHALDSNELTTNKYNIKFRVELAETDFANRFLHDINQGVKGTFYGREPGRDKVEEILDGADFSEASSAIEFADRMLDNLRTDSRPQKDDEVKIESQLSQGVARSDIYDLIYGFDYLVPEFSMELDGKDIRQLSPGERGTLLLILYLLVDNDERPLIIDQPGANLDNRGVTELLVPAIKHAKRDRQIIIVTHNPNLAVVCDAEQIIKANIDKDDLNNVTYESGALEHPSFNDAALDILEGKQKAFSTRKDKYLSLL